MNVIDVLKERGFIEAITSDELREIAQNPLKVYCGFDPTGDSLHVGHLIPLMGLAWFQKMGHTPVALVGGATGMIGDPSGKSKERVLLTYETVLQNQKGIAANIEAILGQQTKGSFLLLNNADWFNPLSVVDFLRDVGVHFRLGPMLSKESVKLRLQSEEGMSFTEFCYQTLQGYDFLHLYKTLGVTVQMGGSDQWGNITAGVELTRKVEGKPVFGITFPLLTRSDGQKFGKTEQGAVWLSKEKCSPYEFYQYFVRLPDADVGKMLRLLTFMDLSEIEAIEKQMQASSYVPNTAQKRLAVEITRLIHGEEGLQSALQATEIANPGNATELNADKLEALAGDLPFHELKRAAVVGQKLIDLLVLVGLQTSKGEARKLMRNGGVYLNNQKILDEAVEIQPKDLIDERLMLIAVGKKNKAVIKIT